MDTELLVENQIDDGWRLLAELVRDGFDISVAFWARTSEEGLWFFYVASPSVTAGKIDEAYRTVYRSLSRLQGISISISEIKLLHSSNPIAREAAEVRDR